MNDKLNILKSIFDYSHSNKNEHLFWCRLCPEKHSKPKLSINLHKNKWKCWYCGEGGNDVTYLIHRFGTTEQQNNWPNFSEFVCREEITAATIIELPEEFVPLWDKIGQTRFQKPLQYLLQKRGMSPNEILKYGIGCCLEGKYRNRTIIPSYDEHANLNYFIARSFDKSTWPSYKNPPSSKNLIFNELFIDWQTEITLVEGFFDIKDNSCCPLLGSTLSEDSRLFQKIVSSRIPVFVALDENAMKKMLKIVEKLLYYDVEIFVVDTRGFSDVGVMSKQDFATRKLEAERVHWGNLHQFRLAVVK